MEKFYSSIFSLLGFLVLIVLANADDQTGFINIDCGAETASYTAESGLTYVWDENFIQTGISKNVSVGYQSDSQLLYLWNLRSFPQGIRNCYSVKVTKDTRYLIRASFLYGNYDSLNKVPEFEVHLGANLWDSVILGNESTIISKEIVYAPSSNHVDVCVVNTGSGTPFISGLEFRPLKNNTYTTEHGSLTRFARLDVHSRTNKTIRYPDDPVDRQWLPYWYFKWDQIVNNKTIDVNDFELPQIIMSSAATPKNASEPMEFSVDVRDSSLQLYVYLHFAELEVLAANESRQFNISLNGKFIHGPVVPKYLSTSSIYSESVMNGDNGKYVFTLYKTGQSTLPPILNAIEFYIVKPLPQQETDEVDVDAMTKIKSIYKRENWQGDPCAPQLYVWDGLNCSYEESKPPRIISLNLSSSELTGEIPSHISNLTMIEKLDLSNNNLTGPVPEFLSGLKSLSVLNLAGNNLKGPIPPQLLEKSKRGTLSLSFDGNPSLCSSISCDSTAKKKKKTVVIPVVASLASFLILLTLSFFIWKYKGILRNPGKKDSKTLGIGKLDLKNRRFSYTEIVNITNNFEMLLGEGSFGKVFHGYLDDGTEVAVKMLSASSRQGYDQFEAEVELLLTVHHRNLTALYGYCDEVNQVGLIYEYMANGNLKEHLRAGSNADVLSWEGRLHIAVESAQGLEYLHYGCKPNRVHRDVKSANILLDDKFQAKIADFGLIRSFPGDGGTHVSTVVAGTFGYLDPEYCQSSRLTEKSDVYSFGVVLLEIITNRPVITNSNEHSHIGQWVGFMLGQGDIKNIVDQRLQGDFDINSAWKFVELAMQCISPTSIRRPTMNHVVVVLKECLAMEMARIGGQGNEPVYTLNMSSQLAPLAR